MDNELLLDVNKLKVSFWTERGKVDAVEEVSFHVYPGETIGIVGESGCGKSVTSESILRLLDEDNTDYEGSISYKGKNLLTLSEEEMRKIRGNEISMIFQDPMSSLNPVYTIGDQIVESIRLHQKLSKKKAYEKAVDILRLTGIPSPEQRIHEYPHELSGGMRQRVMIALAISCEPRLLIADEPTTALDVTIQAQILELITDLQKENGMGVMLITHDLAVVAEMCTRVVVMYLGQVIEETTVDILFKQPLHPYTKGLMNSMPKIDGDRDIELHEIGGSVPSLHQIPKGCRFAPRCQFADDKCRELAPVLEDVDASHKVRCWHYREIVEQEASKSYATS